MHLAIYRARSDAMAVVQLAALFAHANVWN